MAINGHFLRLVKIVMYMYLQFEGMESSRILRCLQVFSDSNRRLTALEEMNKEQENAEMNKDCERHISIRTYRSDHNGFKKHCISG